MLNLEFFRLMLGGLVVVGGGGDGGVVVGVRIHAQSEKTFSFNFFFLSHNFDLVFKINRKIF